MLRTAEPSRNPRPPPPTPHHRGRANIRQPPSHENRVPNRIGLTQAGVHPKDAQALAQHSTITLTMGRYTHTSRKALAAAVESLSDNSKEPLRATGTCGVLPRNLPTKCAGECTSMPRGAPNRGYEKNNQAIDPPTASSEESGTYGPGREILQQKSLMGRGRLEPPTHGFSVRCHPCQETPFFIGFSEPNFDGTQVSARLTKPVRVRLTEGWTNGKTWPPAKI